MWKIQTSTNIDCECFIFDTMLFLPYVLVDEITSEKIQFSFRLENCFFLMVALLIFLSIFISLTNFFEYRPNIFSTPIYKWKLFSGSNDCDIKSNGTVLQTTTLNWRIECCSSKLECVSPKFQSIQHTTPQHTIHNSLFFHFVLLRSVFALKNVFFYDALGRRERKYSHCLNGGYST